MSLAGDRFVVSVRLFARARDLAGKDMIAVDLPAGAKVQDLRRLLGQAFPALETLVGHSAMAVDDEFADDQRALRAGMRVALLPPVSGGQDVARERQ